MVIEAPRRRGVAAVRAQIEGSIRTRLRLILGALLAIQLVLVVALIASTITTQRAVSSLLGDGIQPISELQTVANGYAEALTIANKVQSGNMTAGSGVGAVESAKAGADAAWRALDQRGLKGHDDALARIGAARAEADRTTTRLLAMLRGGQVRDLDFFVSGALYAAVDPLTTSTRALIETLRGDAGVEAAMLGRGFVIIYIVALGLTLLALAIGLSGARAAERTIVAPLGAIAAATRAVGLDGAGEGIPGLDRSDEIGDMARALLFARERAGEARRLEESARRVEGELRTADAEASRTRDARAAELDSLFARFERDIAVIVATLAQAGGDMRRTAAAMSSEATASEGFALSAASAADQSAASVRTVLESGEALAEAIARIRDNADEARRNVQTVREQAAASRKRAKGLTELTTEIGAALGSISGIARQTNMLALNASIEASRAGAAGAGFAVVADEVKALARQSEAAAAQIGERLGTIERTARDALASAETIDTLVSGLDQSAEVIADAASTQSGASREIAGSIGYVEAGSNETARNMVALKDRAETARRMAAELSKTADGVAEQTEYLRGEIAKMVEGVKAA